MVFKAKWILPTYEICEKKNAVFHIKFRSSLFKGLQVWTESKVLKLIPVSSGASPRPEVMAGG